jgi:hypothetical protein
VLASITLAQPPSTTAIEFLSKLNDTDPNSAGFEPTDDDNNNAGWGHYQYTSGGMNMRTALSSWSTIGSSDFAQQLLAAGVKISKVARHLCETRKRPPQSFTADSFLRELVEHVLSLLPVPDPPKVSKSIAGR